MGRGREDFSGLRNGKKMPEVRHELLTTMKAKLIPSGILDEFKSAGVFVNWWQQIRYDLKTIISTGWHHSLIPDDHLGGRILPGRSRRNRDAGVPDRRGPGRAGRSGGNGAGGGRLEPEEGENVTAAVIKKVLKELIDDLKCSTGASARKELATFRAQEKAITDIEKRIKEVKTALKVKIDELALKLQFKRLGGDEFKAESQELIRQVDTGLTKLDPANKVDKEDRRPEQGQGRPYGAPRQNRRAPRRHRWPAHRRGGPWVDPEEAL